MHLRTDHGLTQIKLAELAGCQSLDISRYERGDVIPRPNRLVALAEAMGVNIDDFKDDPVSDAFTVEQDLIHSLLALPPESRKRVIAYVESFTES